MKLQVRNVITSDYVITLKFSNAYISAVNNDRDTIEKALESA